MCPQSVTRSVTPVNPTCRVRLRTRVQFRIRRSEREDSALASRLPCTLTCNIKYMSMTTNKESFFELTTPRDMLEKAKRELIRLEENLHIDHVYNFFTTAYHIQDYLKNGNYLSQSEVDKFFNDQDLKDCRDICHKGKHLKLERTNAPKTVIYDNCLSGNTPLGSLRFDGGTEWVMVAYDGREADINTLARSIISKWEKFFENHNL